MSIQLKKIKYSDLNPLQQENYNFQKISAVLAEYGFTTMRLTDDWQGADFIALHVGGDTLKVQLKGRLTFEKKYEGKNLYVAFPHEGNWYLYPHDKLLGRVLKETKLIGNTKSWKKHGGYDFRSLSKQMRKLLEPYRISGSTGGIE